MSREVKSAAFFTANAVQLNTMSSGAGLLRSMVKPLVLFFVTRNLTSSANISCAIRSDDVESSSAMLALRIGVSIYGSLKVMLTELSPALMSALPAVSAVKYGRPKNVASLSMLIFVPASPIESTMSPPFNIV